MQTENNALIVEDDMALSTTYKDVLSNQGFNVTNVHSIENAHQKFNAVNPKVVILDLELPDGSGFEFYKHYANLENTKFVIITGHADIETAIAFTKTGVAEFVQKPVTLQQLKTILTKVKSEFDTKSHPNQTSISNKTNADFIANSRAMHNIKTSINKIATTDLSVAIEGESGTGKEVIAEHIHKLSGRTGAFVPVNCGSISSDLITSELFGHVKGSFTGAYKNHMGYFEQAEGGTIFLDEITEMPLSSQVHLLRVLESKKIKKVGGAKLLDIDVRILSASNRNLESAVSEGRLREDLYYRIRQFPIQLPRLADRAEDIVNLAHLFLQQLNTRYSTNKTFSDDYLNCLHKYHWPGNIRQLKNTIFKSYFLCESILCEFEYAIENMKSTNRSDVINKLIGLKVIDVESQLIISTLKHCNGNKNKAAKILGISLKTLYNKLSYINK